MDKVTFYLTSLGYFSEEPREVNGSLHYSYIKDKRRILVIKTVDCFQIMDYNALGITIYRPKTQESVLGYITFNIKD